MRHRKRKNRGGAMVEFALLCPVWLTLLLGTMWYGTAMIRGLIVTQTARDLASMYCRAVDFSATDANSAQVNILPKLLFAVDFSATDANSAQVNILPKLVHELGTISTTGGTGVTIFSQFTFVGDNVCQLASGIYWDNVNHVHTASCTNWNHFVF